MNNEKKAINLFKYIRELYAQRYKVITNIKKEQWYQFFEDIPINNEYIKCPFLDKNNISDDAETSSIILQITKPTFEDCPEIPDSLKDWIDVDWEDYSIKELKWKAEVIKNEKIIKLGEDSSRLRNAFHWGKQRQVWLQKQEEIEKINNLFQELRYKYDELKQEYNENFESE